MNTSQSRPAVPEPALTRQDRQRVEILRSVGAGQLHRAADLAHEHLAEFPSDRLIRSAVSDTLARAPTAVSPKEGPASSRQAGGVPAADHQAFRRDRRAAAASVVSMTGISILGISDDGHTSAPANPRTASSNHAAERSRSAA